MRQAAQGSQACAWIADTNDVPVLGVQSRHLVERI